MTEPGSGAAPRLRHGAHGAPARSRRGGSARGRGDEPAEEPPLVGVGPHEPGAKCPASDRAGVRGSAPADQGSGTNPSNVSAPRPVRVVVAEMPCVGSAAPAGRSYVIRYWFACRRCPDAII